MREERECKVILWNMIYFVTRGIAFLYRVRTRALEKRKGTGDSPRGGEKMIHRSVSGIHTFITNRGLFLRVDPVKNIVVKIKASRVNSHVDQGFVNILDEAKEKVSQIVYLDGYHRIWACTKEEFYEKVV